MSRLLLLLSVATMLALSTTGCLRSATTVLVHKDGSATITDTTLFSPRFLAMMKSLDKGFGGEREEGQEPEDVKPWSDSSMTADALDFGADVTLDSWKEITVKGMEGYVAIYTAPNVNTITLEGDRGTKKAKSGDSSDDDKAEDTSNPWHLSYANGVLKITNPPEMEEKLAEPIPQEPKEEQSEAELRQTIDMMAGFMRDMKFSVTVAVDGQITETNALHRRGNSVILMAMDFDKMVGTWQENPEAFREFDKVKEVGDVQSMQQMLDQYPEGAIQIETQQEVTIRF